MSQEIELAAPCGVYCGPCPYHRAATDRALAEKLASQRGLEPEAVVCLGCRAEKGVCRLEKGVLRRRAGLCQSYDCCINQKGLQFCYQCPDFPCLKLAPCAHRAGEIPHNTKVYNLVLIQKIGLENWLKEAENIWNRYFQGKIVRGGSDVEM
jgi:hypothetical protein